MDWDLFDFQRLMIAKREEMEDEDEDVQRNCDV